MKEMRRCAMIQGNGIVTIKEEEIPELKENEVLLRVHASLISPGTEIGYVASLRQNNDEKVKDAKFGYSNAGEIIAVKGDVKGFKVGQRVAAMGAGYAIHSDYSCVPVNMLTPIPEDMSYEEASFACLGATALQAVRRTEVQLGEYGLVAGLGIVGNLAAQLYSIAGARVLGWEGMEFRIDLAKSCGINNIVSIKEENYVEQSKEFFKLYGSDFALMAFGGNATPAFNNIKSCMKVSQDGHEMGRIVLVGGCKIEVGGGAYSGNLDIRASSRTGAGYHDNAYEYGKDYPNCFVQFTTERNLREIVSLIHEGRLKVEPMITHRLPLSQANEAADLLINTPNKAMAIILTME